MTATHPSEDVLGFWLESCGPGKWYAQDDNLDDQITRHFGALWRDAADGKLDTWKGHPRKALGFIILTDQFPRNMFRNSAMAFSTDRLAKSAACYSIDRGWDMRTAEPGRQFFYMPFCHSEVLSDQDHCVRLMKERMPETGAGNILHARVHREIIRRFGRFPYRNAALGRATKPAEQRFMDDGGYGLILGELEAMA
ncbi:MAG: DUF924 domain-containing protein [Rhodobacteraceae bacterium]|nr:DUF924 domain-containing protein [Paracoccaceae bacterium]